ncbi:MAG TPA: glycosyltransferase [Thermoanaerobaculia bacterium]|nr:glycosyltransferase [Thermoanaerobaculia bacterium]
MIDLAQIVLESAPPRQRRLAELDRTTLGHSARITTLRLRHGRLLDGDSLRRSLAAGLRRSGAGVAHVYAFPTIPSRIARQIAIPFVAPGPTAPGWLPWPSPRQPTRILGALAADAVEEAWFAVDPPSGPGVRVGIVAASESSRRMLEATRLRVERFRDDLRWIVFDRMPGPEAMREIDVWLDPSEEPEADGGTPEAMAAGKIVVAAATEAGRRRLDQGRAGFLVPPGDANEMAHALLNALFKPELARPRAERGRAAAEAFHPSRRAERLLEIYRSVTP